MADAKPKVLILGGVYVCALVFDTTVVDNARCGFREGACVRAAVSICCVA